MQINFLENKIKDVANKLRQAKYPIAITGAGISVSSGIPPFRGEQGLWSKYDPMILEINYFQKHPEESWKVIREIFYDFFGKAKPNPAHYTLAHFQETGFLYEIITQNIDNLHQEAGSSNVVEFHGNSQRLVCTKCGKKYYAKEIDLEQLPPLCPKDNAVLKPDFIFFGEAIPSKAYSQALEAVEKTDLVLVIGTTGEVVPASQLPYLAKENGAQIIEINPGHSAYTHTITDIYLKEKAESILPLISDEFLNKIA